MARVNVEESVYGDPRYRILAKDLGVDVWSAIGRMTALWRLCQETCSYVLGEAIVNHLFDDTPRMCEALLKSGLGKKHRHGVYISGTRGRIEWLETKRRKARENGQKGGRPPGTNTDPTKNQDRLRAETPLAPALALTEEKEPSTKVPKRAAGVESFTPSESLTEWARAEGPSLNLDAEVAQFIDHHTAKGSKFKNTDAAFRTWIRNAVKFNQPRFGPRGLPSADQKALSVGRPEPPRTDDVDALFDAFTLQHGTRPLRYSGPQEEWDRQFTAAVGMTPEQWTQRHERIAKYGVA